MPDGPPIHGPEIGFARFLQTRMPDDYLFVKAADNIPTTEKEFLWSVDKPYMRHTLQFFEAACTLENVTPCPAAILMEQGIDEALSDVRFADYEANLFGCIENLRAHFHNPDLPLIIKQSVNSPLASPDRMAAIRQCQQNAAIKLPKVGLVTVDDLKPYVRGHHFSSPSQLELGRRLARIFLELIDKPRQRKNWWQLLAKQTL